MALTGVDRYAALLQAKLPGEWRQVAMLMSRGGRFDRMQDAWTEAGQTRQAWAKPLQVWSEELAGFRHAMTGERYSGCPTGIRRAWPTAATCAPNIRARTGPSCSAPSSPT